MSESGMFARSDAETLVEPTGVEPTGVEPTGVDPTGVEPTGAEPSWPATSICSTLVDEVTFAQLPPSSGTAGFEPPHQLSEPSGAGRDSSGVLPSSSEAHWTLRKRVVAKLTSFSGRAARWVFALVLPTASASVSAFSGWPASGVPLSTWAQVAPS